MANRHPLFLCSIRALLGVFVVLSSTAVLPQEISPRLYQEMRWRMIGPFRGGRTLTAAGVPGQPDTYYFGAVAGGVWRTTNGGNTWLPIFDQQPVASIGALAIAPSDPKTIYVGTGEADMRSNISFGMGVYRSYDAGATWTHVGLSETRHIAKILVDPRNPDIVLVAALGHAYGPNPERGVFRTTDGGHTWQKVLYKDENTGAIDLAADPADPHIICAAMWNAHRTPWSQYPPVNGPGGGLYKSIDGGSTWAQVVGNGLPGGDWGRAGIAIASARGIKRIYVLVDAQDGGLFRSDNDGKSWERVSADRRIRERGWYFGGVTVVPQNPDTVYVSNVALYRSTNGGRSFEAFKGAPGGDDYHLLWIDPQNSARMIFASDQGAGVSVDAGASWSSWFNQPTAQFYHVAVDNQFPYYVYGAQQDSGTVATVSRSDFGSITYRDWYSIGAGEAGYIAPDPGDPNTVYGGDTYGALYRFDKRTGQSHDISPLIGADSYDLAISQRKLRFTWTSPLVFSPFDPHTLYFGSQYVLRTTNQGSKWEAISPDLTGASPKAAAGGPLTPDSAKQRGYGVVYTIAPSAVARGLIWVGSDTGVISLTRDEGKTWTDVTPHELIELGAFSKISLIEAGHFDAGTAYVAVDRHRLDDYLPHIYRTHDFGKTWTEITQGINWSLPRQPAAGLAVSGRLSYRAYVHAVREDPVRRGLLYAATELGVCVSFDDGDHWQSLQLNLPVAPVHDLVVNGNDLAIATHGRSFWILDDVAPLREANAQVAVAAGYLFPPQTAIRVRRNVNRDTPLPQEFPAGENPPAGAILDYYLGADPAGGIILEILDSRGRVVRRFSSADPHAPPPQPPPFTADWIRPSAPLSKSLGMHRFAWDLRYPTPPMIVPEYSSAVAFGENTPAIAEGALGLPGEYEVRLSVGGQVFSRPLRVEMDPRVRTPRADLERAFALEQQISEAMERDYRAFRQAEDLHEKLASLASSGPVPLRDAAAELDRKLLALAGEEESPTTKEEKLSWVPTLRLLNRSLAAELQVVQGADTAPTEQVQQAFANTCQELQSLLAIWQQLRTRELAAFNDVARKNGGPQLVISDAP
jgi:photosystem II stability/assembly factor-like uncharacterized protein